MQKIGDIFKNTQKTEKKIVVLGYSGVGKTQFIYSLIDELREKRVRASSVVEQDYKVNTSKSPILLLDTVGQTIEDTNETLEDLLEKDKVEGIINVVSYGYVANYRQIRKEDILNGSFFTTARDAELEHLDVWLPTLSSKRPVNWIVTLINQADIWYHEREQVLPYYQGKFSLYQTQFERKLKLACKHIVLPYSSILELYLDEYANDPDFNGKYPIQIGTSKKNELQDNFLTVLSQLISNNAPI